MISSRLGSMMEMPRPGVVLIDQLYFYRVEVSSAKGRSAGEAFKHWGYAALDAAGDNYTEPFYGMIDRRTADRY